MPAASSAMTTLAGQSISRSRSPRLTRRMMARASSAAVVLALILEACSPGLGTPRSSTGGPSGLNDANGLNGEYQAEVARLEFPPGVSPPPRSNAEQPDAAYEAGLGTSSADFAWLCAWFSEYMGHHAHDRARATHALEVLDRFPQLGLWNHMDPAGRQTIVVAIADARAGKIEGIYAQREAMMCAP